MDDPNAPESVSTDLNAAFNISDSLVPARDLKAVEQTNISFDGLLEEPLLLEEDLKEGCGDFCFFIPRFSTLVLSVLEFDKIIS
ncbi:hypothetical protein EYZ11_007127 [Aspergillus tanneri]|uniref:Uncharacterized protein n=1 Tax=Aspergillus tanneri TaxID=1220188 RepID=A0A4S3JJD7_9EURO|nr:hypothetical protein EYZ11_007127 [Aspergillus tanneri]